MRALSVLLLLNFVIHSTTFGQQSLSSEDSLAFMDRFTEGFKTVRKDSSLAMEIHDELQHFADSADIPYFRLKVQRLYIAYLENWGMLDEADSLFTVMIDESLLHDDKQNLYSAYAGKAAILYRRGKHGPALEYYFKAIDIAEVRDDSLNLSRIYNNLSLVQNKLKDYEGSIQTLRKALSIKKALKDSSGLAANYLNLGNVYSKLLNEDSALTLYRQSASLYRQMGDTLDANLISSNIGELYYHLERYDLADAYIDSSLAIKKQMRPNLSFLVTLAFRGGIDNSQGQHAKALESFNTVQEILGGQRYAPVEKEVYKGKADAYAGLQEFDSAYVYMAKLRGVEEELNEENEIELQEKYEALFFTKEKENQLKVNELELDKQKGQTRLWTIIGAAALLLFILAGILAVVNRRKKEALAEKNAVVTKSLHDREVLLREIHHRVKNNLQIISSMLSIQSRRVKDKDARSSMLDSQNRVKSMSLIHEHLYKDDHLAYVNLGEYIDKLISNIRQSYRDLDVDIEKDIQDLKLDIDTTIHLGLILNEAVTNSMKHAFKDLAKGRIEVKVHKEDEKIHLEVSDNGSGFDPSDRRKDSFGMTMMEAFTESLEGEFKIDSDNGTRLVFMFKSHTPEQ